MDARTDIFEILRSPPPPHFTGREVQLLRAAARPDYKQAKHIAFDLGIVPGTLKIYYGKLYRKLNFQGGSQRMLALYAIAHREILDIPLPTPDNFLPIK